LRLNHRYRSARANEGVGQRSPRDPRLYNRATVAYRSRDQQLRRRRIEALIRLAAPALDLVLYAGDRVTRVIGRNEIGPEPARRPGLPPPARH
jgi:hypothetical protein